MKSEDKRVLITGGSGFVGQHLVKKFIEYGHEICVYDLEPPAAEVKAVVGDIFDTRKLKAAIEENDVVIHLIGLADAGIAQKEPEKSFDLNVRSLLTILEAYRPYSNKKVVFPSSAAVYGITEDLPIKESFPLNPTNIYSWHKYVCEKLLRAYRDNFGIDFVILRMFNNYGKGNRGTINAFVEKAKRRETIESFAPHQYRDFVYVGDVAEALYKAAVYEKATNRVVNIGSGEGIQIAELLDLICELFPGTKWTKTKTELVTYDSIADITLAKILLDFEPHTSKDFIKKVIMEEMI